MEKKKQTVRAACVAFLGNRGITDKVKRCAYYQGVWFIVFSDYPGEVTAAWADCSCFEPWGDYPVSGFKWNAATYQTIKAEMDAYLNRHA